MELGLDVMPRSGREPKGEATPTPLKGVHTAGVAILQLACHERSQFEFGLKTMCGVAPTPLGVRAAGDPNTNLE